MIILLYNIVKVGLINYKYENLGWYLEPIIYIQIIIIIFWIIRSKKFVISKAGITGLYENVKINNSKKGII